MKPCLHIVWHNPILNLQDTFCSSACDETWLEI